MRLPYFRTFTMCRSAYSSLHCTFPTEWCRGEGSHTRAIRTPKQQKQSCMINLSCDVYTYTRNQTLHHDNGPKHAHTDALHTCMHAPNHMHTFTHTVMVSRVISYTVLLLHPQSKPSRCICHVYVDAEHARTHTHAHTHIYIHTHAHTR